VTLGLYRTSRTSDATVWVGSAFLARRTSYATDALLASGDPGWVTRDSKPINIRGEPPRELL
jgi:hypothetical protein